jgi:pSer/pThr/pTyr-binding forkhead associated (FHA) protein
MGDNVRGVEEHVEDQAKSDTFELEDVTSHLMDASASVPPPDVGIEDIESGIHARPPSVPPTAITLTTIGLEEVDHRGEVALHRIVTPEFRIGRHPECNLVLHEDPKISRRHARILRMGDECSIEDNGSINGTFLNGQKLTQVTLMKPGDKLRIGAREFTFVRRQPGATEVSSGATERSED